MGKKILSGHVSPETAFVIDDYPYGFRLRCKIRYWLEHHPKHGTRLWSQTTNPKIAGAEVWNKPKCSTYAYIAGAMYLNEQGHVEWSGLSEYSTAKSSEEWLNTYKEGLTPEVLARVENWVDKKKKYEQLRNSMKGSKTQIGEVKEDEKDQ